MSLANPAPKRPKEPLEEHVAFRAPRGTISALEAAAAKVGSTWTQQARLLVLQGLKQQEPA